MWFFDWLAAPWNGISQNASLVLKGGELKPVVDRIWDVLKKYRNVDFNPYAFGKVEKNLRLLPPFYLEFKNPDDSFEILNTPMNMEKFSKTVSNSLNINLPFVLPLLQETQDI
jgi:hypothetical protein